MYKTHREAHAFAQRYTNTILNANAMKCDTDTHCGPFNTSIHPKTIKITIILTVNTRITCSIVKWKSLHCSDAARRTTYHVNCEQNLCRSNSKHERHCWGRRISPESGQKTKCCERLGHFAREVVWEEERRFISTVFILLVSNISFSLLVVSATASNRTLRLSSVRVRCFGTRKCLAASSGGIAQMSAWE